MEPDAVEIRVVGCLIEKQRTTPDAYPLSLNSLRLACNQSTNRDPVVDYDEATVVEALRRLALRGWTRLASGAGSRARKYRHLLPEALGVDGGGALAAGGADAARRADPGRAEAAQRAPALLRRPGRGPGDARTRWSSAARSPATSAGPARRRTRYEQLLGGLEEESPAAEEAATAAGSGEETLGADAGDATAPGAAPAPAPATELVPAEDRLTRLERELKELRTELAALREALGED